MAKWTIKTVERVEVSRTYTVQADSEEEAVRIFEEMEDKVATDESTDGTPEEITSVDRGE